MPVTMPDTHTNINGYIHKIYLCPICFLDSEAIAKYTIAGNNKIIVFVSVIFFLFRSKLINININNDIGVFNKKVTTK